MNQKDYWNANLNPDNLEHETPERGALARELAFSDSPDQVVARVFLSSGNRGVCIEIGSGLGAGAVRLAEQFPVVIATDLAFERLKDMRENLPERVRGNIFPVVCRAENLPFRLGCADAVCSRAVLIHTSLSESVPQCRAILAPQGRFAFAEPLCHNPFVNVYRATFAPRIWKEITTYFDREEIGAVQSVFPGAAQRPFYFFGFLAFVWQYALPCPFLFRVSLRLFGGLDGILFFLFPPLKRRAWFILLTGVRAR